MLRSVLPWTGRHYQNSTRTVSHGFRFLPLIFLIR
ncbi:MAG: CRISPR-associated DxTHG motif protein [Clostridiales bacterium]|nr:CRISPR-associated DxTHG motif protein [Clostridiales bacterium]